MARRRKWEAVGEPLFGEDWWRDDQRLFADSLTRQAPAATRRAPRPRRPATLPAQASASQPEYVQGMLPWFEEETGVADESVRGDGPAALGEVAAPAVRGNRGSGQLLHRPGRAGLGPDRGAGVRVRGRSAAGRGIPGPGGEARPGPPAGRGDRPARDDPARTGAGSRRGPEQLATFRPAGQEDLAPSGAVSRIRANLAALALVRDLQRDGRLATPDEQAVLGRWSGWGAVPEVFDEARDEHAWVRERLAGLMSDAELAAAKRTTLNAHYTDAALVQAIWGGVRSLGFTGGRVLEPGCGSGNFIAFAPPGARMTGIELDPVTAGIAALLHPRAEIRAESFAETRSPAGSYDLAIGNVPFGKVVLRDKLHNAGGHASGASFISE